MRIAISIRISEHVFLEMGEWPGPRLGLGLVLIQRGGEVVTGGRWFGTYLRDDMSGWRAVWAGPFSADLFYGPALR